MTLVAGIATTVIACFPFVFTRLLDFVGLYGLLLAPAGAIVLAEHWFFPRLGLTRYWVSSRQLTLNGPALAAWASGVAFAALMERTGTLHLFYLFLPVYLLTSVVYILLAAASGARQPRSELPSTPEAPVFKRPAARLPARDLPTPNQFLKRVAGVVSLAALVTCLAFPVWVVVGGVNGFENRHTWMKLWLTLPTLVYFVAGTVFFLQREKEH